MKPESPSNISPGHSQSPDEIDLLQLFIRTVHFFRRHARLFLIALMAGILLAGIVAVYYSMKPRLYSFSGYMVGASGAHTDEIIEVINGVVNAVNIGDTRMVALKLGIPESLAANITAFSVENLYSSKQFDVKGNPITNEANKLIKITLTYTTVENTEARNDSSFMSLIRKGILNTVENNTYIKEKFSSYNTANREMVKEIDNQLVRLRSAPDASESLTLLDKRAELDSLYHANQPIRVVEDFNMTRSEFIPGPSRLKIVLLSLSLFFLSLIYALIKETLSLVP